LPSTIEQVHREFGPRGLVVLAVNLGEGRRTVETWVRERKVTSTVLLDPTGAVTRAYRVVGTPTVVLIARDGTLVGKAISAKEWTGAAGRDLLGALLAR